MDSEAGFGPLSGEPRREFGVRRLARGDSRTDRREMARKSAWKSEHLRAWYAARADDGRWAGDLT